MLQETLELQAVGRRDRLVGVQHEDPVARRLRQGDVSRFGEIVVPRGIEDLRTENSRNILRAVRRARVDDDDLVDGGPDAREAADEMGLLVFDDHAEGKRFPAAFFPDLQGTDLAAHLEGGGDEPVVHVESRHGGLDFRHRRGVIFLRHEKVDEEKGNGAV